MSEDRAYAGKDGYRLEKVSGGVRRWVKNGTSGGGSHAPVVGQAPTNSVTIAASADATMVDPAQAKIAEQMRILEERLDAAAECSPELNAAAARVEGLFPDPDNVTEAEYDATIDEHCFRDLSEKDATFVAARYLDFVAFGYTKPQLVEAAKEYEDLASSNEMNWPDDSARYWDSNYSWQERVWQAAEERGLWRLSSSLEP